MYKKILLLSALLAVNGCGTKEGANLSKLLNRDEVYHISLLNTEKAQLIASLETKALLTATYLNPLFKNRDFKEISIDISNGEYFFVGVFIKGNKIGSFNKNGYSLKLNGREPIEVKEVDKDDPLKNDMPMVNGWSSYYRVKYPKINADKLNLVFKNDRFGNDTLEFSKNRDLK
jgi:hypothetical protein